MSRTLCLSGMMGAGKSTVARLLGQRLGRRAVDTDEEIERWTGESIPALFDRHGEAGFRALEHQVVAELARFQDLVIALGGGVVLSDDNVSELLLTGVIVHLDVPSEVLQERLAGDHGRPLLAGENASERLASLHTQRHPRYLEVADVVVDARGDPEEVTGEILRWAMAAGDILTPSEHEQVMT